MPNRLVFVRHGHSEGNLANEAANSGDKSLFTPEFRDLPGRNWRLTELGRQQARIAGDWIRDNIGEEFDRYYVSPYVRTKETAALLGLANADWRIDPRLRERDYGDIGSLPRSEAAEEFPLNARTRVNDRVYWRTPNGESIPDVRVNRVRSFFDTLHRETAGMRVLVVTHGDFMWATRAELEYMSDDQLGAAFRDRTQEMHNTQVLDYTRIDPETDDQAPYLGWTRSVNPQARMMATAASAIAWNEITRPRFSNAELLAQVEEADSLPPIE